MSHICLNMTIEFIKVDLTYHLRSPENISQNKIVPYATCMEKLEFKSTIILFTLQKREIDSFLLRNLPTQI